MNCSILAIATATPPHRISQRDAAAMALSLGNVPPGHERSLVAMYRQTRIRTRGSVVLDPPEDGVAVQRFFAPDIAAGDEGPTTATRRPSTSGAMYAAMDCSASEPARV